MGCGSCNTPDACPDLHLRLTVLSGTEIQGQPHLTFLPGPPFTPALQNIRPRPLSDAELGVPDTETNISALWPAAPASWLKDDDQYITGLNSLADVLMVWERAKIDMAYKEPEETLRDGMARLQAVLDNLVPELRWRGGLARFPKPSRGHESQTVNILITCFYIRSNLLQHLGQAPGITHQSIVRSVTPPIDSILLTWHLILPLATFLKFLSICQKTYTNAMDSPW